MDLKIISNDKFGVIQMIGQFWEHKDFAPFDEEIENFVNKGLKEIVLDMARLSFISSQGLGLLVKAFSKMKDMNGRLILLRPSGTVRDEIEIAGFSSFMTIIDSKKEVDRYLGNRA